MNLISFITQKFCKALTQAFPAQPEINTDAIEITTATQEKFGHYQCNSAMKLTKILKIPPKTIAEQWIASLKLIDSQNPNPIFATLEVAGPGFINISLSTNFITENIKAMALSPSLSMQPNPKPLKIVIDFSAPNTAKEMHVGHLRSTIIGDSLARILRFMGHDVIRLNHIGDWGTQFGMLVHYIYSFHAEVLQSEDKTLTLAQLMHWYRESKKLFDTDEVFKKNAQLAVVQLQQGEPRARAIWEKICHISRIAYQQIYDLLDIELIERGESFHKDLLEPMVKKLDQLHLLQESEGAKCVLLDGFTNRDGNPLPLIIQKSDGGYNYATTDLAALEYRINVDKADWIIYVVDAGQSLHLNMVFACAKQAKIWDPAVVRVNHVAFGLVLGNDGKKFKTRSGDTERLIDLLNTGIQKAAQILQARNPNRPSVELYADAAILGINAIKYADLSCNRLQDYAFSYEKMLRFEGNTAAFLMYAFVRIQSIKRKAQKLVFEPSSIQQLQLSHPAEIALAFNLSQFAECLEEISNSLLPHRLTDYLYHLAEKFHVFFHHCPIIGTQEETSRLVLCEVTARVLQQGFSLLGLKTLEEM